MSNLMLFALISLVFLVGSYIALKSFLIQRKVRHAIKEEIILNKSLFERFNNSSEAYVYIFNSSVLKLIDTLNNKNQAEVEKLVNKELNRQIKGIASKSLNTILYLSKIASSAFLLLLFLFFGSITMDEFNKSKDNFNTTNTALEENKEIKPTKAADNSEEKKEVVDNSPIHDDNFKQGLAAYELGDFETAKEYFNLISKNSKHYAKAKFYLEDIEYYSNLLSPTYGDITKSSEDYKGKIVSFAGTVYDINEFKGKSLIILNIDEYEDGYEIPKSLMILYSEKTNIMEGELITIFGEMKGRLLDTEDYVSKFFNRSYSYLYSPYTDPNQMPVILADTISEFQ